MTAADIDAGTNARTRSTAPGIVCLFHGAATKRSGAGTGPPTSNPLAIRKALADAIAVLTTRLDELRKWNSVTRTRFIGWFGTDSDHAKAKIGERIVKAINKLKHLSSRDFVYDPTDSDYAFVYPGIEERGKFEKTVHLGKAFWTADDKTRAGTLIHEVSHFLSVGGTDDVGSQRKDRNAVDFPGKSPSKYGSPAAYGGARAARLAISNPSLALKNADSFEFFIEGRDASVIKNEQGELDTEGFGDFPDGSGNLGYM
jgi:Lysine-specific metallo-endopeptidase